MLALPVLTASGGLLGSCSLLGPPAPRQEFALTAAIPPITAAYLVADLVRRQIRGADPSPSAFAPVLSCGGNSYTVLYTRQGDDGFRVFLNGRITPPEHPRLSAEIVPCPLDGCRFVPAGSYTGSPMIAEDEIYIRIQPLVLNGASGGCRVEGHLRGLPTQTDLQVAICRALTMAVKIRETAALLENREFRAVEAEAAAAVAVLEIAGTHGQPFLLSRLLCHRAAAASASGDLVAARAFLGRALDHDERLQAARCWLLATDRRLANLHQARRNLLVLAHAELPESLRSRAQAALIRSLRNQGRDGDATVFEQRAKQALKDWDLTAAYAWARRAIGAGSTSPETQAILARVHGLRAQHQLAFEEELLLFNGGRDQPGLIVRMAERHLALGNAPAGLRLLALSWHQACAADRPGAIAVLERLLEKTGPELACRILVSAGASELAEAQLREWRRTGGAANVAISLLERVPELRARERAAPPSQRPAAPQRRSGFESAPGLLPRR